MVYEKHKHNSSIRIDRGFVLNYFKLSYRRKFIRTLFTMLVIPMIIFVPNDYLPFALSKPEIIIVLMLIALAQAIYNYKKWKETEESN